jgi:hypothetical protein
MSVYIYGAFTVVAYSPHYAPDREIAWACLDDTKIALVCTQALTRLSGSETKFFAHWMLLSNQTIASRCIFILSPFPLFLPNGEYIVLDIP